MKTNMGRSAVPHPAPPLSRFRRHGDLIFISGQVPIRSGEVVSDDLECQVRQTLENLAAVVSEAGSSLDRILKCNCFLRRESDVQEFNRVYREFFGSVAVPARTTLIASPPNPRMLVEIEAVAVAK